MCGEKVDLRKIKQPVYIYGSREDHIVPIEGAYASTQVLPGKKRFVMGASGHIAGVINPPHKKKRSYWTLDSTTFPADSAQWIAEAEEHPGSWWPDWSEWLAGHGGRMKAAPESYGSETYPVIEPAPGRYVKTRVPMI